jgi:hypothetical protein
MTAIGVPRTKKERTALARRTVSYGFHRCSDGEGWLRCPVCRAEVTCWRGTYPPETWRAALIRTLLAHFDDDCEGSTR